MNNLTLKNERKIADKIKKDLDDLINQIELKRSKRIFLMTKRENLKKILDYLKNKMNCRMNAITCSDNLNEFELIYHLWSGMKSMISTKIKLPRDKPEIESVTDIFPVANLFEREVHDLFGVEFLGHPDLKRIMLNEDWPEGEYPLRKDWIKNEKKNYGG